MNFAEHSKETLIHSTPTEIERKFLVQTLPNNLENYEREFIRQGYLAIDKDGSEVRIRDRNGLYTITAKSNGDLSRSEYETLISSEQFETLWPATEGRRVEKTRFTIPTSTDLNIELDIYDGALLGLVSAEIEFKNETSARAFEVPSWFGTEVTKVKAMKNQQLAENGLPKELFS